MSYYEGLYYDLVHWLEGKGVSTKYGVNVALMCDLAVDMRVESYKRTVNEQARIMARLEDANSKLAAQKSMLCQDLANAFNELEAKKNAEIKKLEALLDDKDKQISKLRGIKRWDNALAERLTYCIRNEASRSDPRWERAAFDIWGYLNG
jgi:hypothetical protein